MKKEWFRAQGLDKRKADSSKLKARIRGQGSGYKDGQGERKLPSEIGSFLNLCFAISRGEHSSKLITQSSKRE
jgi:hypothetical protein